MEVFERNGIGVANNSEKCEGKITRQNRHNQSEISAIDLVTVSNQASNWIEKVKIDEIGTYRMCGKSSSDHNTIIVDIAIDQIKTRQITTTKWNINAPEEKWMLFREKLTKLKDKAQKIMRNKDENISERYKKWEKIIYKAAMQSIGKTTCKIRTAPKPSNEVTQLRMERNLLKKKV